MPPMQKPVLLIALILCLLLPSTVSSKADVFTPLVASGLTTEVRPFQATDGKLHFVYELVLTNGNSTLATLKKLQVLDASDESKVLASFEAKDLLNHLRATNSTPAENPTIEFNGTRLFLIDFTLDTNATPPKRLTHHLELLGGAGPSREPTPAVPLSYTVAPIDILSKVPVISAPLKGKGWVALNGCCEVSGVHRSV